MPKSSNRESLLRRPGVQALLASLLCIVLGLLVGFIALLIINPSGAGEAIMDIMRNFLNYSKKTTQIKNLGNTLVKTSPLLMCALSVCFCYKVGLLFVRLLHSTNLPEHRLLDGLTVHWPLVVIFGLLYPLTYHLWVVVLWLLLRLARQVGTIACNAWYTEVAGIICYFKLPVVDVLTTGVLLLHREADAVGGLGLDRDERVAHLISELSTNPTTHLRVFAIAVDAWVLV